MTPKRTRMLAVVSTAAHFTARMSQIVAIHGRILGLSAEAEVVTRHFFADRLTRDTPPLPRLGLRVVDPRFDAVEMLDVVAVGAVPGRVVIADLLAANHALEGIVLDVFDELVALRQFRGLYRAGLGQRLPRWLVLALV